MFTGAQQKVQATESGGLLDPESSTSLFFVLGKVVDFSQSHLMI
jgi:hypothetical protein